MDTPEISDSEEAVLIVRAIYSTGRCQLGSLTPPRLTSFISTPLQERQTKMSCSGRTPSFEIVRKCFMVSPHEARYGPRAVGYRRRAFDGGG